MSKVPSLINLNGKKQYRIIPSSYPPINFFEELVDASEMETLWEIESLTNERLREEAGDISLVNNQDRISGPGSSVIMAAFTHLSTPSRFTDGTYGVYYASLSIETAIRETTYHRERFLSYTNEEPCELSMRMYEGKITKPLHDIRKPSFKHLHHPTNYKNSQEYGSALRNKQSWGLIYNSVRHEGNYCIAAFRPPAISIPHQTSHFKYIWDGSRIVEVLDTQSIFTF